MFCFSGKVFYSKSQTTGHIVEMHEGNLAQAREDILNQIPLHDFLEKYPEASIQKYAIITKTKSNRSDAHSGFEFDAYFPTHYAGFIFSEDTTLANDPTVNHWIFNSTINVYEPDQKIIAFYLPNGFSSTPIPPKYARMIRYADCVMDTASWEFIDKLTDGSLYVPKNWASLSRNEIAELVYNSVGNFDVSFFSQSDREILLGFPIALIASEINYWPVFIRAHLEILSYKDDRMPKNIGRRKTFMKELEALELNLKDLLLGILLRIENPSMNHYYANFRGLGRSFVESKHRSELKAIMISIIKDPELDYFNRLSIYYLYRDFIEYLSEEKK
jgi:hypothetical protein